MRSGSAKWLRYAVASGVLLGGLGMLRADVRPDVKVALVVGNSAYSADVMKLKTPAKDARDIAAALKADGFDVDLRLDVNERQFRDMLGDFERKSKQADISLFYYAGHGMQLQNKNFLLPTDNYPRDSIDVKRHSVPLEEVVDAGSEARKAKIVILDACRDGHSGPAQTATRSLSGLGDGDGLAAVSGASGLVVFFSAQHGKQALDSEGGDHSPFAEALLRHVSEPGRKLVDVLEDVSHDVSRLTKGAQEPEIMTASLGDADIFLNPKASSADAWSKVRQSKDPKLLKQFIAEYPDAPQAETAQAILDGLDAARREQERIAEEQKRAAAAEAAIALLKQDNEAKAAAEQRRRQQEQADKDAAAKKLAEIEANLKAERAAMEARLAEAKRQADERLAEEQKQTQARLEEERRKAAADSEESQRAAELRARQAAEAAAQAATARLAAEAAEAARRQAEAANAAKWDAELADVLSNEKTRREAAARAEQERVRAEAQAKALAEAARQAREAERRVEMQAEAHLRVADRAEVQRRVEEEMRVAEARKEEERRRHDAELQEKQLIEQACADDRGKLAAFQKAGQSDAILLLRRDSSCPTFGPAVDQALKEISDAQARTCDLERKALSRLDVHDPAGFDAAADTDRCPAARDDALKLADRARQEQAAAKAVCAHDEVTLAGIDASRPEGRASLLALEASACAATHAKAAAMVAEIDERVADAQKELARLGCLAPAQETGRFDEATVKGLNAYFAARNAPGETVRVTEGILDELSDQDFKVCAPATPVVAARPPTTPESRPALSTTTPQARPATPLELSARPTVAPLERPREAAPPSHRLRRLAALPRDGGEVEDSSGPKRPARVRPAAGDGGGGARVGATTAPSGGGGVQGFAPPSF